MSGLAASFERPHEWVDPTGGELSTPELRGLVRSISDRVGQTVAARVQKEQAAGRTADAVSQQAWSHTEIAEEVVRFNERRVAKGLPPLSTPAHDAVVSAVMAHVYGLGELDDVWSHPDVEEIDVNGHDRVYVTFTGGEKKPWPSVATNSEELVELIRRVARRLGPNEVDFDSRHPQLDLQLPDGSRLFAVFGGSSGNGIATEPCMSIRRHRDIHASVADLDVMPAEAATFVTAAFAAGENLIVAGDHNAGKTTMLRAICHEAIGEHDRVITVEAGLTELALHRSNRFSDVVALYSRPPSAEGEGEVTVADLVRRASRRLNPWRVIVGEILGDEVGPVLDAFSGSTRGSGCTIHARTARDVTSRFELYGLMSNPPVPSAAIHHGLASAAPIIVHLQGFLTRGADGDVQLRRRCTSITEITGLEDGRVSMTELWALDAAGVLRPKNTLSSNRRERIELSSDWRWQTHGWVPAAPFELSANGHRGRF